MPRGKKAPAQQSADKRGSIAERARVVSLRKELANAERKIAEQEGRVQSLCKELAAVDAAVIEHNKRDFQEWAVAFNEKPAPLEPVNAPSISGMATTARANLLQALAQATGALGDLDGRSEGPSDPPPPTLSAPGGIISQIDELRLLSGKLADKIDLLRSRLVD